MLRFKFVAQVYDEYREEGRKYRIVKGYTFGRNNAEAIENICRYWGDTSVEKVYVEAECNDSVIIIEDEAVEDSTFDIKWKGPALNEEFF